MTDEMTRTRREPRGAEEQGEKATYMNISYGCLCEISKTPVPGWVEHQIKNRDTGVVEMIKWIKVYKGLEIWVNDLKWYSRDHDGINYSGWKMHGEAGGINYVIDFSINNPGTKKLLFTARAIKWEDPLQINVWSNAEGLQVQFKQDDVAIKQYYKKGDMKECPAPVQRQVMGKNKWDWDATNDFLWKDMEDVIVPHIRECAADRKAADLAENPQQDAGLPAYSGPVGAEVATDDDIPF